MSDQNPLTMTIRNNELTRDSIMRALDALLEGNDHITVAFDVTSLHYYSDDHPDVAHIVRRMEAEIAAEKEAAPESEFPGKIKIVNVPENWRDGEDSTYRLPAGQSFASTPSGGKVHVKKDGSLRTWCSREAVETKRHAIRADEVRKGLFCGNCKRSILASAGDELVNWIDDVIG